MLTLHLLRLTAIFLPARPSALAQSLPVQASRPSFPELFGRFREFSPRAVQAVAAHMNPQSGIPFRKYFAGRI
jgi:hypothetical protein